MADSKKDSKETKYTIAENGGKGIVQIADDVVTSIVGLAVTEVDGVARLTGDITRDLVAKLGKKNLAKGIRVAFDDNEDGTKKSGTMRDQVDILFAGPQLSYRFMGKTGRSALLMNMALGYMAIRDRSKAVSETLQIDGACLGFAMDLTYEYKILDALWLGLQLSALGGSVSSATVSGTASTQKISLEEREGLAHVVVSAGIRYCL